MHVTGKWNRDSVFAWIIVIALHVLAWRELSRIDAFHSEPSGDSTRLRLTWIEREPPRVIDPPVPTSPSLQRAPQARSRPPPATILEAASVPIPTVHTIPPPTRSLSAVFIEQARHEAERMAHAERLPADPFASRNGGFQRPAPDTIRMKREISLQDIVAGVGQLLFAPPGYELDPCPRNERNIRKLMDGSDPKAMQRELEYEREYCRP